jgi:ubiquinone/menaquinone biosynthesis C-methylase UbiE
MCANTKESAGEKFYLQNRKNKVTFIATHTDNGNFEKLYLQLREKEGRIYTDEEVPALPEITETNPHHTEWQMRKQSCQRLTSYLQKKQQALKILEVGCGNGWLSHRLSTIPGSKIIGADINFIEIQQAAKVFRDIPNLHFVYSNIESEMFEERQFDIILFAASIQYFPSLPEIIAKSMKLLKPNGEIHIIDSHFYQLSELSAARQRSLLYYESAGFPEMANFYFHHCLDDIEHYNYSLLYDPNNLFNKFLRNKSPFPWILIQ